MSKAYEMISESLNEIIKDLEETDGKNLKRESLSIEISDDAVSAEKISNRSLADNFSEPVMSY
ncbi:MAG: hypothetical protein IJP68_06665 [Selenomonadaceae bacterium]|nr:hypothetical protein [Selenomonadaceae bacterium]